MKLASLRNGTRDGQLVVVSRSLDRYASSDSHPVTMQAAIEDWDAALGLLEALANKLEHEPEFGMPFDQTQALSPLPRAYQWADGSAYLNHVELVRKARGAEMPESLYSDPLMYQGGSDGFIPPRGPIPLADDSWGCDMEAEIAVIVDDVPRGVSDTDAAKHIKLIMLCNDVSLRNLIPAELSKGFGFFQSKPASSFSPVAVTPDELGDSWSETLVHLPLHVNLNGKPFGRAEAGKDAIFNMAQLVAHAAKTRELGAGTIIGSGTVSNKGTDGGPGRSIEDGGRGYSCIAELRTIEKIEHGEPKTRFLTYGDVIRIGMVGKSGESVFGAIEQTVERTTKA